MDEKKTTTNTKTEEAGKKKEVKKVKKQIVEKTEQPEKSGKIVITSEPKRLYRSKKNAMIAGVAAGLGEYFVIDPAIVRLIFVLATVFGGFGIPLYIILWVVLPENDQGTIGSQETVKANTEDLKSKAGEFAKGIRSSSGDLRNRTLIGYILIGLGIVFVLENFGFFRADIFWPLILVVIGLMILRS